MTKTTPTPLAKNIRSLRKHLKMTQGELERDLGVTQATVSRWETGEFEPSLRERLRLAARDNRDGRSLLAWLGEQDYRLIGFLWVGEALSLMKRATGDVGKAS